MKALGPVMIDMQGVELTAADRRRLTHPLTGGVILFSRNYASRAQLQQLAAEIRDLRNPHLLIAVDQEGGRVQRFREGFTRLPPMRQAGELWDRSPQRAKQLAYQIGWVMAAELRSCGVDFSFAPVLDLDHGRSSVIGDRAFHADPQAVSDLAHGVMRGMAAGGMAAVGKHFPGHGYVAEDSHTAAPVDNRDYTELALQDLTPFKQLIDFGLPGMMPAHVIYPKVDAAPAGFSTRWLKRILREEMGFDGVIFSDDLSMAGAAVAGGIVSRAEAALDAGCDMVLACNAPDAVDVLLDGLKRETPALGLARLARMHGRPHPITLAQWHEDPDFLAALHAIGRIGVKCEELPL